MHAWIYIQKTLTHHVTLNEPMPSCIAHPSRLGAAIVAPSLTGLLIRTRGKLRLNKAVLYVVEGDNQDHPFPKFLKVHT